jgi:hypothetical protein
VVSETEFDDFSSILKQNILKDKNISFKINFYKTLLVIKATVLTLPYEYVFRYTRRN